MRLRSPSGWLLFVVGLALAATHGCNQQDGPSADELCGSGDDVKFHCLDVPSVGTIDGSDLDTCVQAVDSIYDVGGTCTAEGGCSFTCCSEDGRAVYGGDCP